MPRAPHDRTTLQLVALLAAIAGACDGETPPSPSAPVAESVQPAPSPDVVAATDRATATDRPMMIVFSRDYCTPCRVMKPWVAEIAAENPAIDVVSVNVDRQKYEHFGRFFQVTSVPTLVFADGDGRVSARRDGLAAKKQMLGTLRRLGWVE